MVATTITKSAAATENERNERNINKIQYAIMIFKEKQEKKIIIIMKTMRECATLFCCFCYYYLNSIFPLLIFFI